MDTDFTYERRTVLSTAEPALLWWDSKSQSLDMSTRQVPHWTYVQNNCFYRQLFSIVRSLRIGNILYAFCKADRCNNLHVGNRCVALAEATGLPPGKWIVRLLTSIHRLTTASFEWRSQVDRFLRHWSGRQTATDTCVSVFCSKIDEHIELIGAANHDYVSLENAEPENKLTS